VTPAPHPTLPRLQRQTSSAIRRCGSPLFKRKTRAGEGDMVRLRLGCLDSGVVPQPVCHVFVAEKPEWSKIHDDLPQFGTVHKV
jgi:hypothetical protein